jgi:hypothetical protein
LRVARFVAEERADLADQVEASGDHDRALRTERRARELQGLLDGGCRDARRIDSEQ